MSEVDPCQGVAGGLVLGENTAATTAGIDEGATGPAGDMSVQVDTDGNLPDDSKPSKTRRCRNRRKCVKVDDLAIMFGAIDLE